MLLNVLQQLGGRAPVNRDHQTTIRMVNIAMLVYLARRCDYPAFKASGI
jgi:hypothetical protein